MPFASDCLDTVGLCLAKVPVVSTVQGTLSNQTIVLSNSSGPIDLTQYGIGLNPDEWVPGNIDKAPASGLAFIKKTFNIAVMNSPYTDVLIIPVGMIQSISYEVLTKIPGANTFNVGDNQVEDKYGTGIVNTNGKRGNMYNDPATPTGPFFSGSLGTVRITPDVTPTGTGIVAVTVIYQTLIFADESSSAPSWNPPFGPGEGIEVMIRDNYNSIYYLETEGFVSSKEDAQNGKIHFSADERLTRRPGIFLGSVNIFRYGHQRLVVPFYYEVTPNIHWQNITGPITVAEVRLASRDLCPELNRLIDAVEYKDEEVMWAIRRPIEYWNEVPPPVTTFGTHDFPFRYHWMNATIGELLIMAAVWMRRNDLDYTAAGLQVADTKKWPDYLRMGEERVKEWKAFVRQKKIEINVSGAYTSLGGYRVAPYR